MKDSPIIGIILGVVVVLLIVIFSLGYQLNKTSNLSSQEVVRRVRAEERVSELSKEIESMENAINDLKVNLQEKQDLIVSKDRVIEKLNLEIVKLNKLKEKLEDNLKEELLDNMKTNP